MEATPSPSLGTLLRHYRRRAGLTQEALAEHAGISVRTIRDVERGVGRVPQKHTVTLLAEALALSARDRAAFETAAHPRDDGLRVAGQLRPGATPLLGRERELAVLDQHLAAMHAPPVLIVAGEPGIGKTRLLAEAGRRAASCGWTVLASGCQRHGGQAPYSPLVDALSRHIGGRWPAQRRVDLHGCAWLLRLLPELSADSIEPLPPMLLAPAQERRLMFAAVAHFLTNVAGPAGTLLVLDDLQWAGADALDLLVALARSAAEAPLRVVGAYRNTEVDILNTALSSLPIALTDLAHAELVTHLTLGPLAAPEARCLLDSLLDGVDGVAPALREQVLRRAGGVPFFVVSCARGLAGSGGSGPEHIPWSLAQSIRQRVAALSITGQAVVGASAVVGRRSTRALLAAATALSEDALLAALEAACRARLLSADGPDGYQFAHDVIREVVEEDLGAAWCGTLHRRVAEALEKGAPRATVNELPAEVLAYHFARSDAPHRAVAYLEQAGDRSRAQYAYATAEGYYRDMAACAQAQGQSHAEAIAREKLGTVLASVARYDSALLELAWAVDAYTRLGERSGVYRAMAQIGWTHHRRGTPQEGILCVQPLLEPRAGSMDPHSAAAAARKAAPSITCHDLAMLSLSLANLYWAASQDAACLAEAERAVELAHLTGESRLIAEARDQQGSVLLRLGRAAEARPALDEAIARAEDAGDLRTLGRAFLHLSAVLRSAGDFPQSRVYAQRCRDLCDELGDPSSVVWSLVGLAQVDFLLGTWSEAQHAVSRAADLLHTIGPANVAAHVQLILGQLLMAQGDEGRAVGCLKEAITLAERVPQLLVVRAAHGLLAERELLAGHPAAAHARLMPLLDEQGSAEMGVPGLLSTLAWASLALGETDEAADLVAQAITRLRTEHNRLHLVDALRVEALVATEQGRWEGAERSLEEALVLARQMRYPYAEARLLCASGLLQARKRKGVRAGVLAGAQEAQADLEAALTIFRRLGACNDVAQTEQHITHMLPSREDAASDPPALGPGPTAVTVTQWMAIEPLLPPAARTGRRRTDDRRALEAILYKQRTGCAWGTVPARYGDGVTAYRRLQRWQALGIWDTIQEILRSKPAPGVRARA